MGGRARQLPPEQAIAIRSRRRHSLAWPRGHPAAALQSVFVRPFLYAPKLRFAQPRTRVNPSVRIVAPKVAGSSLVGYPTIFSKHRNFDSVANPHLTYHYLRD